MATANFTNLLSNEVIARLERLRVNPLQRFTSRHRGEHLSGKGGRSTEFADYRDYSPGDDTRFIDWNIYSRLRRPYLKLFRLEEEMHVVIIIDATESMRFENKLEMAKKMAAAFSVMALYGTERVSVFVVNNLGAPLKCLPPMQGRYNLKKMFEFIEPLEAAGACPLELGINQVLKHHQGRGVAVLLSDFMTFGDFSKAANVLFGAGLEMLALQILGPSEVNPELNQDLRLVDSETDEVLDISSMGQLLAIYNEHRLAFQEKLERICRKRSGRFLTITSDETVEVVLLNTLLRRGWLK